MAKKRATLRRKARKERQKRWNLKLNQKQDLLYFASFVYGRAFARAGYGSARDALVVGLSRYFFF
jgi:hypothetical protein